MYEHDVFISFSSKDLRYVRQLMASLNYQGIDFWDYSDQIQEIEIGADIPQYLFDKIDASGYFIALISKTSVDKKKGRFTRLEVDYAIKNKEKPFERIIPVLIHEEAPEKMQGPYSILEKHLYLDAYFQNTKYYEHAISRICEKLQIPYKPIIEAHDRMPFWEKFKQEAFAYAHSNAAHVELMVMLSLFNEKFQQQDWENAYFLISHFINSCNYHLPPESESLINLFYPYIVKAVCEQLLGYTDKAEKSYQQAEAMRGTHHYVYGGLASVYSDTGEWDKAAAYYKKALEVCQEDNTDEKINYASILIKAGKPLPESLKAAIQKLDSASLNKDRDTLIKLQAVILFLESKFEKALDTFEHMSNEGFSSDTDAQIYAYFCSLELGDTDKAFQLLQKINTADTDPETMAFVAKQSFRFQEFEQAIRIYQQLLSNKNTATREYMVSLARIHKHLGEQEKMRSLCKQVLNKRQFGLPQTEQDFYFTGFAQYLLGNHDRAEYDHERSDGYDAYYDQYEN